MHCINKDYGDWCAFVTVNNAVAQSHVFEQLSACMSHVIKRRRYLFSFSFLMVSGDGQPLARAKSFSLGVDINF